MDIKVAALDKLTELSGTPEEIAALIDLLRTSTSQEIGDAIARRRSINNFLAESRAFNERIEQEKQREFWDKVIICEWCRGSGKRSDMAEEHTQGWPHAGIHKTCYPAYKAQYDLEHTASCVLCGGSFFSNQLAQYGLCLTCGTPAAKKEYRRLMVQISRAHKYAVEATLTLVEWMKTINDFGGECAYCQSRQFSVMEHYVPIHLGGGTSKYNCVPACQPCNVFKGKLSPIDFNKKMGSAMERVGKYLVSR
jgi:5-methylcytosine-specific restriction endonuclease McrA